MDDKIESFLERSDFRQKETQTQTENLLALQTMVRGKKPFKQDKSYLTKSEDIATD